MFIHHPTDTTSVTTCCIDTSLCPKTFPCLLGDRGHYWLVEHPVPKASSPESQLCRWPENKKPKLIKLFDGTPFGVLVRSDDYYTSRSLKVI